MNAVFRCAKVLSFLACLAWTATSFSQTFTLLNIGGSPTNPTLTTVSGGCDLTAGGTGVQGTNDQFAFAYEFRSGDFDLAVRLGDVGLPEAWAQGGLMARNGLTANATFAATLATPGSAGCYVANRVTPGNALKAAGWFPANYPETWLRLQRVGSQFTGYASFDGQNWEFLGSTNITMPVSVPVGLVLSAGLSNAVATAQFRDYANASGVVVTNQPVPFEPLGPSSRRTALVFTEIMYNPPDSWSTGNLQFVELYNSGTVKEDLTGHRLTGDISFDFLPGTILLPGQFLVVAKDPAAAAAAYYGVTAIGPFTGNLPNSGGTLRLVSEVGGRLLEVEYDNKWPWPVAADGAGPSLELRRPSYGENNALAWAASDIIGGSPGGDGHYGAEPARNVSINEFLAHTDPPQLDFIELYNHGNTDVDLSGYFLSDQLDTNCFQFPADTTIPARGFLVLDEIQLGFRLNAAGGRIVLRNAEQTRVLDAVNYDAQENGVATGRWPDGADRWSRLAEPTGGASNAPVRLEDVLLNELMYDPISGDNHDQYVELYNAGSSSVDLGGWRLKGGVDFTFPTNMPLLPGGFMVVANDSARLLTNYSQLNATNLVGNFSGNLSGKGERIALAKPDVIIGTNDLGQPVTNLVSIVVDEVTYVKGGRWPQFANRGGSSLELRDPRADRRQPSSWADSDESQKAPWTTINTTAILENGSSASGSRFEFFLQGPGEALVDNLEMLNNGGPNRVSNPDFESGTNGFTFNGTHRKSFAEIGAGVSGSKALHLVAVDRGDAGPNKVFTSISALTVGSLNTGTIRAQVRWLKGSRFIMLRPSGHWQEASIALNVPSNPGTPGLPNSRLVANAGPAIYEVTHAPVLPAVAQPVVVTARAQDPDGISSLNLLYRVDPAATLTSVPMVDDGTGGDRVASDGLYSATLPGQTSGKLIAFRIIATDGALPGVTNVFPADAPARECLVRWGEFVMPGTLGTYRIWITEATRSFWAARERNANDPMDCTFVSGNSRAIYNTDTLYSGSPFHTQLYNGPTSSICDYELGFRPDEKFLGAENFVLSSIDSTQGGIFSPDPSAQVEITANWIMRKLGQPSNHKRHVHVFVNGLRRGTVYEDSQQPNAEFLDEFYPGDSNGELRKIEDWFEFDNSGGGFGYITATIQAFLKTGGGYDTKRYRWNWRPRATDNPNDWSNFTNLVAAMNTTGTGAPYVSNVLRQVDVRRWLGPIAVHHICGDWDSYGYTRGKNMFAYRSDDGRWGTLIWDIELCLGDSQSNPATDSIYSCHDPILAKMFGAPALQREYLGLMLDALNGPFAPGAVDPWLDARYAALQRNGLSVASPSFIKSFMASRRTYVLTQIPSAGFTAFGPTTSAVANVSFNGSAPINVRTIFANGQALSLTWNNTTAWTAKFLLTGGSNLVSIVAYDLAGNIVGTKQLSVFVTVPTSWPPLRINEWMASNTGSALDPADSDADDWFEIFNPTSANVSLANWTLTDNPTNVVRYTVPAGYVVPANGYLLVWADDETQQNTNTRPDLHADFKLDKAGEAIALFAPDGTLVDQLTFGAQTNDVTQGRWPNGGNSFETLFLPTPGQLNLGMSPFLQANLNSGLASLTFNTKPGSNYVVEWTADLAAPSWTPLGFPIPATNLSLTITDTNSSQEKRFYRAMQVP